MATCTITGILESADNKPRGKVKITFRLVTSFGTTTESYIAGSEATTITDNAGAFELTVAAPTSGTIPYDVLIGDSNTALLRANLSAAISPVDLAELILDAGTAEDIEGIITVVDSRLAPAFVTLTDAATVVWAMAGVPLSNARVTLGGDRTLSITGAENGCNGILIVTQGTGGGHTLALPANSFVIEDGLGAITLSGTEGDIDILTFIFDGTNYYWTYGTQYTEAP